MVKKRAGAPADGGGRSRAAAAEHLARELRVDEHVTFLGKQNHVERLLPLAHVLLMPSELESFGLAALEGMACGVVPVATRVGGVPELITHERDGFLEAVGDIAAQAARVAAVAEPGCPAPQDVGGGAPHRDGPLLHAKS